MDPLTAWLERFGLDSMRAVFVENDIDLDVLSELTEDDLKELGFSLGQRRRFFKAMAGGGERAEAASGSAGERTAGRAEAPSAAPEERRHITVMFCDLVASTALSNRHDPEEFRELMRRYQGVTAEVIVRFGGHVAKFLGDGVLAYFGWPTAFEDQAERAVRAGLELARAIPAIDAADGEALAVRVGIASGEVVIGDLVNATGREEGAVTGETPNLAARLQAEAAPGTVLISSDTERLVQAAFEMEDAGARTLKGFSEPVPCHRVLGARLVASRFEATRGASLAELIGRVHETGLLRDRWARTCEGQGQVVLLSGEAGIGKSRLVEAIAQHAESEAAGIFRLQGSPHFANSAFHPAIERISRVAGILETDGPEAKREKVRAVLAADGADVDAAMPVYERLLLIESDVEDTQSPQEIKEETLRILIDRPVALARRGPVLVLVEDMHWVDPSTQELMERMVPIAAGLPMMIVVTHRPDWTSDWSDLFGHATALTVGRLERSQIAELMAGILGAPPGDALVDDIAERTDGVPLYVEEFCQGLLGQDGDATGVVTIPASLQSSVMARLDQLPRGVKSLALIASAIGREFDARLLARVAGVSRDELDAALAELRRMRIVFASGSAPGTYVFRHALIRDTAYQSLLTRTRRAHHAGIARALVADRGDIATREPELLAYHFTEAGEPDAALPQWTRAAERALARSATFEAVSHARHAFRIARGQGAPDVAARILLGRALESAGQIASANQILREAISLAREIDDSRLLTAAALAFANTLFLSLEPPGEALAPLEEVLDRLDDGEDRLESQVLSHLVRGSVLSGDRTRLRRYRSRAAAAARAVDDRLSLHGIQVATYVAPIFMREPDEISGWRARVDEMLETADGIEDDARARARSIAFSVAAEMADRARMEQALERLKEVGAARQHMHIAWVARHGDAMLAILDGRFDEAETCATEALEIGRRTHGAEVEGVYGIQMFTIRREQGRLAEVAPVIKRLIDDDPEARSWKPGFAVIAADLGFEAPARRVLDEVAAENFALEPDAKYSTTLSYLAEVAIALDDRAACETLYDRLLPYRDLTITAGVTTVCLGAAARHLGRLATALGAWDEAASHLERALEVDRGMRAPPWIAHSRLAMADLLRRRGRVADRADMSTHVAEALEAGGKFGMVRLQELCRQYLQ